MLGLSLSWSLVNPNGTPGDYSGFKIARVQWHELSKFRLFNPHALVYVHTSVNSIRKFDGSWRFEDYTQPCPPPERNPAPVLKTSKEGNEVWFDFRNEELQELVLKVITSCPYKRFLFDDFQMNPDYLPVKDHHDWAISLLNFLSKANALGIEIGVNLSPIAERYQPELLYKMLTLSKFLLVERCDFSVKTSFYYRLLQDFPDLNILFQWVEMSNTPNLSNRYGFLNMRNENNRVFFAIEDVKARQVKITDIQTQVIR